MSQKNPETAIRKLKKQIQRLKKELIKNENLKENFTLKVEDMEEERIIVNGGPISSSACPKCQSNNTGSLKTPSGIVVRGCKSCKSTFR